MAIALGLISLAPPGLHGAASDYQGRPVGSIEFDPAIQPLPENELLEMIPVKAGAPLRLDDVHDAIVRLYSTGRYQDIAVDAETVNGAVVVKFITRTTWFIGRVSVEGVPEPPNAGQLANATRLELGREFSEEQAQNAMGNILDVLRNNGFYEARVERFLDYEPAFAQVNVLFLVDPGPRARFSRPTVAGVSGKEADRVIGATDWSRFWFLPGWKEVSERRVQRGMDRIRRSYQKRHYLLHRVTLEGMEYVPQDRTIVPTLKIEPGPIVRIETEGASVSEGTLRRLVPIYQEQSVDRDLLVEGARNLTQHFQARGYFDATVAFESQKVSDELQVIDYVIDTGRRYKLVHLGLEGNRYFDEASIRERLSITPATPIRYRNGRYSQALLESDLDAIRNLYRANGFRDVEVTARTENPYRGNAQDVAVFIEIDEKQQWIISELDLEGVGEEHEERVRGLLASSAGQPFSEFNIAIDRDNVLDYYFNGGYLNTGFEWSYQTPAPGQVALRIRVSEGPQRFVRAILMGGLTVTDPDLVMERVRLRPGDPLSQSRMVESQRRLYDLGIFARVLAAVQNPEGVETEKYLLTQFEEARRYSLNLGVGAQITQIGGVTTDFDNPAGATGFSPRISVGISRANMFGVGHTAAIQARATATRQRALTSYLAPQFEGNERVSLNFTGLYDLSEDINTFKSLRWEGAVFLTQRVSRATSFQYGFAYRQTRLSDIKISEELVPIFVQTARVGLITAGVIQDRRDDPLDSTRGTYNAIEGGVAYRYLGSQTDYFRVLARNSTYHRIGTELVLARSVSLGWLANTASDPAGKPIPIPELFFSGGSASHRGFPENQAGPRDPETGFVIGGRALLNHNLELRFPMLGDSVSGVVFHDAGNLYSQAGRVSLRYRQRNEADFDYMVHAFGIGIRYRTPVGPVRFDLSYSPNAPRFFGFRGTREELIAGGGEKTHQRIGPIQFFFSIGQTF
ncbi:MAG: BamA/TamA family outer membrane protein [Bryobacteraceae bacterium]|nr:BamA/TamA family outer membrane protein [Bryobacteraceae bacterium]